MKNPRELVKQMLPARLQRLARFVYRLPVNYRADYSYQICAEHRLGHGIIALTDDIAIALPDHSVANSVFHSMAFETTNRAEVDEFLQLAAGCKNLVDVGASGGFFSALFVRSRKSANVLSIEFDSPSLSVLEQTKTRNSCSSCTWIIDRRGVSDQAAIVEVVSSGYGGAVATEIDRADAENFSTVNRRSYGSFEVSVDQLRGICSEHQFRPDIIKVDIEGFEHEMVTSSINWLNDIKPRLSFELHVEKLYQQGKNPKELLSLLDSMGYKLAKTGKPAAQMINMVDGSGVARAGLRAD
jgi:FkbM family methyltransferase